MGPICFPRCLVATLIYLIHIASSHVSCRPGHWPLTQTCSIGGASSAPILGYRSDEKQFTLLITDKDTCPGALLKSSFNVTPVNSAPSTDLSLSCGAIEDCAVFVLFPFDPRLYGGSGSNYYVFHVDILLPTWNYVKYKLNCKDAKVFMFHYLDGRAQLQSNIFSDDQSFWMQSLHYLFGHRFSPGAADGMGHTPPPQSHPMTCFREASFGVGEFSNPSSRAVKTMARFMREKIIMSCLSSGCKNKLHEDLQPLLSLNTSATESSTAAAVLGSIDRALCNSGSGRVGIVTRRGRRRIVNELELYTYLTEALPAADFRFIDFGFNVLSDNRRGCADDGGVVEIDGTMSGGSGTLSMTDDLLGIQDLSVLIGLQGSGLINGLYMSKVAVVAAIYSSGSWPLPSGDPLELIHERGPYLRHICSQGKCELNCEQTSQDLYCDSGDVYVDKAEFLEVVEKALLIHKIECESASF